MSTPTTTEYTKRTKDTITLGSGKVYLVEVPSSLTWSYTAIKALATAENHLGWIKGGFALEYTAESYEETDDLNMVSKIITTKESAVAKLGLITWNGDTLSKILNRCSTSIDTTNNVRTTKIGGSGNGADTDYILVFHHEDAKDGDVWAAIKGHNTAGATLTFSQEAGSVIEPEYKALPHDSAGTLIEIFEELADASTDGDG